MRPSPPEPNTPNSGRIQKYNRVMHPTDRPKKWSFPDIILGSSVSFLLIVDIVTRLVT